MTNSEFRKQNLQGLVDDHARLGFQDNQIRAHLRGQHGVLPTEVIPPPTRAAQRARERYFATGVVDSGGMEVIAPAMHQQGTIHDAAAAPQLHTHCKVPNDLAPHWKAAEGVYRAELASRMQKLGFQIAFDDESGSLLKMTELREHTWMDSDAAFFSTVYRGTGPTLLDRMIHGFSRLYRELGFGPGSNFEVFREWTLGKAEGGKEMLSANVTVDWDIHEAIDVSLYPWFKPGYETTNIQIDAEMAEIFLAGKAPTSNSWVREFLAKPVYIDIHEKACGQRTISGIFCRPEPSLGTFSYMAVVEWIGQGYEAFIFGEYGKPNDAVVMFPHDGDDEDDGLTQEALDAIYAPITHQVEKIAAMSYMYCRTKLDARQPPNPLNSMLRVGGTSGNDKKERNKEKTHSYFCVLRLEIPPGRFGFTGKTGKSWSLDHLVAVTGHFRWQPYGVGNNLRKLIWIDAYEKGQGVRHRPEENPLLLQVPTAISSQEVQ